MADMNSRDKIAYMNPSELIDSLEFIIQETKHVVFIKGPPGIGKSQIVHQVAERLNGGVFELRLVQYDTTDLTGMPYFGKDDSGEPALKFAPSTELPRADSKVRHGHNKGKLVKDLPVVILFLDEMNQASTAVQASCYQLVQHRRIGANFLPDNVVIVCAGNRAEDKSVTFAMPLALKNRLIHFTLESDPDDWYKWAINRGNIHPDITGFIKGNTNYLNIFEGKKMTGKEDVDAIYTPRTWEIASDVLYAAEKRKLSEERITEILKGTIGPTAIMFMEQRRLAGYLPDAMDIVLGKEAKSMNQEITDEKTGAKMVLNNTGAQQMMCIRINYILKDFFLKSRDEGGEESEESMRTFHKYLDNAFCWMKNNLNHDLMIVSLNMMIQSFNIGVIPHFMGPNYGEYIAMVNKYMRPNKTNKPTLKDAEELMQKSIEKKK